jgi:hypothetical protein
MLKKCPHGDEQLMWVVRDQPALEQRGAVAGTPTDEFDAASGDGLAEGDDGQDF